MKRVFFLAFMITIINCDTDDNNNSIEPVSVFELLNGEWKLASLNSNVEPIYDAHLKFEIVDTVLHNIDNSEDRPNGSMTLLNANIYGNEERDVVYSEEIFLYEPYHDYLDIDMTITDIDNIGISDDQFVIVRDVFDWPIRLYIKAISLDQLVLIGDGFLGDTTFYYNRVK